MTKENYDSLVKKNKYWQYRWNYISEVINILKNEKFNSVLELGGKETCIVNGSDRMDVVKYKGLKYHWDATVTPYPIKDKQYDLFVALQVWEHLYKWKIPNKKYDFTKSRQKEAFKEVMRISKMAILSIPYKWNVPNNCHHMIDEEKIAEWTLGVEPVKKVIAQDRNKRIIYFFKFDGSI